MVFWMMTTLMTHNRKENIWYQEVWWAPVCHDVGDGLVFKAMMACLILILCAKIYHIWPMCFLFVLHACLLEDFYHVCSMM